MEELKRAQLVSSFCFITNELRSIITKQSEQKPC
jgi:hypothetical protein